MSHLYFVKKKKNPFIASFHPIYIIYLAKIFKQLLEFNIAIPWSISALEGYVTIFAILFSRQQLGQDLKKRMLAFLKPFYPPPLFYYMNQCCWRSQSSTLLLHYNAFQPDIREQVPFYFAIWSFTSALIPFEKQLHL